MVYLTPQGAVIPSGARNLGWCLTHVEIGAHRPRFLTLTLASLGIQVRNDGRGAAGWALAQGRRVVTLDPAGGLRRTGSAPPFPDQARRGWR
jgi:hypothetical protein